MQQDAKPINWELIHKEYADYKTKQMGTSYKPPVPQAQSHGPMHAMMVHAMSQAQTKPGEDHGTMIIRALSDHLKRLTPDVSAIHKQPQVQQ